MSVIATERPPEFDAKVMAHVKALGKLALRYTRSGNDVDDLVGDTVVLALHRWKYYNPKWALGTWLRMLMREISRDARVRKEIDLQFTDKPIFGGAQEPSQESSVYFVQVMQFLFKRKNGNLLFRSAMGDTLQEISGITKTSKQDVGVKIERTRARVCREFEVTS